MWVPADAMFSASVRVCVPMFEVGAGANGSVRRWFGPDAVTTEPFAGESSLDGETWAELTADLLGVPLEYTDAQIAEILSPRHFVDVRRTPGGPAPEETGRALGAARETLARDREWVKRTRERIAAGDARLKERAAAL